MESAPANKPATPASNTPLPPVVAPAIPITKLKFDTKPSLPPNTAALNALPPTERCLFSNLANVCPDTFVSFSRIFCRIFTWLVSFPVIAILFLFLALIIAVDMLFSVSISAPRT